jgi:tetratricopeptide (TPR) repeat protein
VERRFAVHAGDDAAQALKGWPRARIIMAAVVAASALVGAAGTADARPKRRDSKAAFDRGVVAYQKGNFQGASEALGKSFELERDVDTLFAWAQAERKLEHCDKAIDLYQQLLTFNLPAANRSAVENKLTECRTILAQQAPTPPPAPAEPVAPAAPPPAPAPSAPAVTPSSAPASVAVAAAQVGPPRPEEPPAAPGAPYVPYKDPVALGLVGGGVVAAGIGVGFLIAAHSASNSARSATTYQGVMDANHKVDQRNTVGGVGLIAGGALAAGGVGWVWWKHRAAGEHRTVTGWLAPGGGGLVIAGPF